MSRTRQHRSQKYFLPQQYAKGTLADILFGHGLYFLMDKEGQWGSDQSRVIETSFDQLETITGLTRKTLRKLIDQALATPEPLTLAEEEGIQPYTFRFKLPHYKRFIQNRSAKKIQIPYALIENGWLASLSRPAKSQGKPSRFPLTILNLFLQLPPQKSLGIGELTARIKRKGQKRPPSPAQLMPSIQQLIDLTLLEQIPTDNGLQYQLNRNQLQQKASQILKIAQSVRLDVVDSHLQFIRWGDSIDQDRTKLTLELLKRGNFHLETHFKEIFYDVGKLSVENDRQFLYYAIDRHRNRPQSSNRWQACYKLFLNRLDQQSEHISSETVILHLDKDLHDSQELNLAVEKTVKIRWGRWIIWINDHRPDSLSFQTRYPVTIKLSKPLQQIWSKSLTYEYERLKVDLTSELQTGKENRFFLSVESTQPQPFISIKTYIEALVIHPISGKSG